MSALRRRFFGGIVAVLAGLALAFQFPATAYADDAAIDETNFPDANFRTYVSTMFDTNGDGILKQDEADAVTDMDVSGKSITSLRGVEHFTKLTTLKASSNQLTAVDVSHNTNLTQLNLRDNQLTAVDLSANTNLRGLDLNNNHLTAVDVSHNTKLTELNLGSNELTAVDLSANTNLRGSSRLFYQSWAVRVPGSSRLVPVDQLSAGFDAGKVTKLEGATIVDGQLKLNEGASKVTYKYATGNDNVLPMSVTLQVMVAPVYTVSFDMGGHGAQVAAQSVLEGELASAPAASSAKGWEFKGWYTDNTFATAFDFTKPINADVTVHAKWEKAAGEPTTEPTGKSTAKPTHQANQVNPEGWPITGANSFWIALLGAAAITGGWLLRRRHV